MIEQEPEIAIADLIEAIHCLREDDREASRTFLGKMLNSQHASIRLEAVYTLGTFIEKNDRAAFHVLADRMFVEDNRMVLSVIRVYIEQFSQSRGYAIPTQPSQQASQAKYRPYYLTPSQHFVLNAAVKTISDSLGDTGYGAYLVGSSLTTPHYHDVDIRFIMQDAAFETRFPGAGEGVRDPYHLLVNASISDWLARRTGLPVDFQIQKMSEANERYTGPRNAIGL